MICMSTFPGLVAEAEPRTLPGTALLLSSTRRNGCSQWVAANVPPLLPPPPPSISGHGSPCPLLPSRRQRCHWCGGHHSHHHLQACCHPSSQCSGTSQRRELRGSGREALRQPAHLMKGFFHCYH
ncbi:RNA recognition motif containing protein [Musa troglodytarum]|uniref:RNA recognition motif containing protein n=1 Tax=Musa troglodytarum TaxID=320322 RepID=A0A9E7EJ75_9LILI|nr:RNA recognition motif containing protein [Musa troglodytarum]URD78379.1 RNA recognition motif containing protein [Musa troglodytarum]